MSRRGLQLALAAAMFCVMAPSVAFDSFNQPQHQQGVKFYFSVPLDGATKKERTTSAGFALQGKREYETVKVDSNQINNFFGGGIEAKWIIAGVIATGAVIAVASKSKTQTNNEQQQQQQAQQQATTTTTTTSNNNTGGNNSTGGTFHPDGTPHVPGDNCACHGGTAP